MSGMFLSFLTTIPFSNHRLPSQPLASPFLVLLKSSILPKPKSRDAHEKQSLKQDLWSGIAAEMHAPWRTVESMHWQMGEEEMATRAGVRPFNRGPTGTGGGGRIIGGSSGGAGLLLEEDTEGEGWVGAGGGTERRQRRRVVLPSSAELERGVPAFAARAGMLGRAFDEEEEEDDDDDDDDDDDEGDEEEEERDVFAGFRAEVKREIKREG